MKICSFNSGAVLLFRALHLQCHCRLSLFIFVISHFPLQVGNIASRCSVLITVALLCHQLLLFAVDS